MSAGCLSIERSFPAITYYTLAFSPTHIWEERLPIELGIKKVVFASAFESQQFIYRTGEHTYENDFYNQYLIMPASIITC